MLTRTWAIKQTILTSGKEVFSGHMSCTGGNSEDWDKVTCDFDTFEEAKLFVERVERNLRAKEIKSVVMHAITITD